MRCGKNSQPPKTHILHFTFFQEKIAMTILNIVLLNPEARALLDSLAKLNLIKIQEEEGTLPASQATAERKYKKMHLLFEETGSCLSVQLDSNQVENWLFDRSVHTNYKTSDRCVIKFETDKSEFVRYEGYVPHFFPGEHYGDYVQLSISKEGVVQKLKVTDAEIEEVLRESE